MQKILTVDFSNYTDEQLTGFATWLNGNVTPSDVFQFLTDKYVNIPVKENIASYNTDLAAKQAAIDLAAQIEAAQNAIIVTLQ